MAVSRHPALLRDSDEIVDYITGGKATFTIKNKNTGNRATYRVEAREGGGFDVFAFTGSDNALKSSYTLMGRMDDEGFFTPRTEAHRADELEAAVAKAPKGHWVDDKPDFRNKVRALLRAGRTLSKNMAYRFNGACSKYKVAGFISDKLKLTVPASIELGMGEICADAHGKLEDWKALDRKLGSDLDAYLEATGRTVPVDG